MKRHIPNAFTLANLTVGCLGIWLVLEERIDMAIYLLLLSVLLDFLDGFMARLLNVKSEIGKQLDSMADMVSFGVFPGFIAMWVLSNGSSLGILEEGQQGYLPFIGLLLAPAAGLRLAKFNIDTSQETSFRGLPTPAMALLVASLSWSLLNYGIWHDTLCSKEAFIIMIGFLIFIMNSNVSLIALKFKGFSWEENQARFILILTGILLFLFLNFDAVPLILVSYFVVSFLFKDK